MLVIEVGKTRSYNDETGEFIYGKGTKLVLEHSLVSIAKWESKWETSFIDTKDKTSDESIHYIECMTITKNVNSETYKLLSEKEIMK